MSVVASFYQKEGKVVKIAGTWTSKLPNHRSFTHADDLVKISLLFSGSIKVLICTVVHFHASSFNKVLASLRSAVSNPSVNQP